MYIKILFTTRDEPLSNLIKTITGEPVSHCAIEIPERKIVIHSNWRGIHIASSVNFRKDNKVIYELTSADWWGPSYITKIMSKREFTSYDFLAFTFLGISLILRKYLKVPLPKSNLWNTTGMFCSEWVSDITNEKSDPMLTPYGLYKMLKESEDWVE